MTAIGRKWRIWRFRQACTWSKYWYHQLYRLPAI